MMIFILMSSLVMVSSIIPVSAELANEGMDLYAQGEFEKSIEWFENILEKTQGIDRAPHLNNIGAAYLALGRFEDAEDKFNEAVSADPSYWVAWVNLGVTNEKNGNTDGALQSYTKAAEVNSSNAGAALVKKGNLLAILGNYDDARTAFMDAKSTVKDSDIVALYTGLGAVLFLQKDYSAAEEALNQAIQTDPDNAALAYTNLGVLKATQGKTDEARTAFEQAIRIDTSGVTKAADYLKQLNESENKS